MQSAPPAGEHVGGAKRLIGSPRTRKSAPSERGALKFAAKF
jgi:hypothetical protein